MAARDTFLSFSRPVLDDGEMAAVVEALRSGWITTGPRTAEFQKRFAESVGASHALGVNSCTAALFLALRVVGIGKGDEVIVPALTFAASANVVEHLGARPVFVDVDAVTGNIDPAAVEAAITGASRAIIPVHLYGRPVDVTAIRTVADRHGLVVIADCAHATETRVISPGGETKHVADFADLAAFSFYATKNLTTGEGGMLTSHRAEWMEKAAVLSLHGMSRHAHDRYSESGFQFYDILDAGYKFNMTDIQAALGIEQLKRLPARLRRREAIWRRYDEAFTDLPLDLPVAVPDAFPVHDGIVHARHLYTPRLAAAPRWRPTFKIVLPRDRNRLLDLIQAQKVGVAVHFRCLPLTSFYRERYGYRVGQFPRAEAIADSTFSLPMNPYLTDEDVESVIDAVRTAMDQLDQTD